MKEQEKTSRKIALFESNLRDTIRVYLLLTQPLHGIRKQGIEVLSLLLYFYHISEQEEDIDKWAEVFSYDTRIKIRTILGDMSEAIFNNQLTILRKKGAIKNNRVVPSFNPVIQKDSDVFELILRFKLKNNG